MQSTEVILRIPTTSLKFNIDKTFYNHLFYDINDFFLNKLGVVHLLEKYDDVSCNYAEYSLMDVNNNVLLVGVGDPIPEDKFDCGGVFIEFELYRPDLWINLK